MLAEERKGEEAAGFVGVAGEGVEVDGELDRAVEGFFEGFFEGLGVRIDLGSWPILPIFELLRRLGNIPVDDWRRTFNLGIGMILVVSPQALPKAARILDKLRESWHRIGTVIRTRGPRVVYQ